MRLAFSSFRFFKWQALGNDFILIEGRLPLNTPTLVAKLCHRKLGVGADGVIFLEIKHPVSEMHFFNADGSKVAMCGNGLRSAMCHLMAQKAQTQILLAGRVYGAHFDHGKLFVEMPYPMSQTVVSPPYEGTLVLAGVPHFLIPCRDLVEKVFDQELFANRYHGSFGLEGANLTFYKEDAGAFYIRSCERGVDEETLACGSAAIAVALLAKSSLIEIIYKTGQKAMVKKTADTIFLAGTAELVYEGIFPYSTE